MNKYKVEIIGNGSSIMAEFVIEAVAASGAIWQGEFAYHEKYGHWPSDRGFDAIAVAV